jgi:ectoine hydroxylase-related dioxygenase (phytanoyl-CoA dioxygenase family)
LTFTPEVEEGDIIIFPSYLKHAVPGGIYDSHRVTISFNLFITQ